jgi:hypothetical protein
MCFGNDSPPAAPYIPPPPSAPEMLDIIDEITGTQSIVVTGADGKKRRIQSRLPRTPEEQSKYQAAEELVGSSMKNIQQLYKYDPRSMIDFAPLIETFSNLNRERMDALGQIANIGNIEQDIANFKTMNRELVDEQYRIANRSNEENLAHSGRGSGTYAAESRAFMDKNQAEAMRRVEVEGSIYGEELAGKRLNRNTQAYNLQEMGRQSRMQEAEAQYALTKDQEADLEKRRRFAIEENQNLFNIGQGVVGADLNKSLSNNNTPMALAQFNAEAGDSMNRYNSDVNRQMTNYNMAMSAYKAQPPSAGEIAANVAANGIGQMFTASGNTAAGRLGRRFIG